MASSDEQDQHDRALRELAPPEAVEPGARPRQDHRRHHEHAGGVAERPGPEDAPELVGGDHVAQAQRQRPERRADERRDQRARDERQHVRDPLQRAAPAREAAQQHRGDHERDRVPDRLRQDRPERRREVAEEQVADHDPRPQPHPVEEQDREAEARRRPQRGDRTVQIGQLEPDPTGEVVRQRGERERARVEDRRVQAVRADSAEAPSAHGIVPTLVRAVRQRTPSR